jgi:hypothetical protein
MQSATRKVLVSVLVLSCLSFIPTSNASGGLADSSFGTNGYLVVDEEDSNGSTYERIYDVASQGQKLVLAGEKSGALYVSRLTPSGQLDPNFGGQSTGSLTLNAFSIAHKIAMLNDGSFFVLGSHSSGGQLQSAIVKFTASGELDNSFSQIIFDNAFDNNFNNFDAKDIVLSPNQDAIYVLTWAYNSNSNVPGIPLLSKFSISGDLDATFRTNYHDALAYAPGYGTSLAVFGNFIYVAGYRDYMDNYVGRTVGQVAKYNSNGTRDDNFPSFRQNYSTNFNSENPNYVQGQYYDVMITDIKISSTGEIFIVGLAYAQQQHNNAWEETEFFVKKIDNTGNEVLSKVIFREDYTSNGNHPSLELYSNDKVLITLPYSSLSLQTSFNRIIRLNQAFSIDDFGSGGSIDLPDSYLMRALLLHVNQRIVSAGGYGDMNANGFVVSQHLSFDPPGQPTIGSASTISSTSASVTFTAPISNGGATITGYTATSFPGGFMGTLAGSTAGTITVTGLSASTAYTFTVAATNSEGTSSSSEASNSITTSAASGGGGTGGGETTTSTTAANELKRQQEAATAAKQKQDQELREILSLVPTIAGLAQGVAGLGNSLLLPKKCVKGKLVKNVKAGAKCPKGYKVRK